MSMDSNVYTGGAKHFPNKEQQDQSGASKKRRVGVIPTIQEIHGDVLTTLANQYWAPHSKLPKKEFSEKIIERIYYKEIGHRFPIRRIMLLEFSQYLELYLWPNFNPGRLSPAYIMSIVMIINEKFRQKVPVWKVFRDHPSQVPLFFHAVKEAIKEFNDQFSLKEQTVLLIFLIHCYNSLEEDIVRTHIQHTVSLGIWRCILPSKLQSLLEKNPRLNKRWNNLQKREQKLGARERGLRENDYTFLHKLIHKYFAVLEEIPAQGFVTMEEVNFAERFLELCVDLQAQLPTRRFFNTLLLDTHIIVRSSQSTLAQREQEGHLYCELLKMVKFYSKFEIDDLEGNPLTETQMLSQHYDQVLSLQKQCFAHFKELEELALANISQVDSRESLLGYLRSLNNRRLHELAHHLNLLEPYGEAKHKSSFILEVIVSYHETRMSQMDEINAMPLYPTEEILWDENVVPNEFFSGEGCLALPKLNLQFLTLHDYLLRNFNLFRLETMYEIRQDVEDAVLRLCPFLTSDQSTQFSGWARMALPVSKFSIVEVAKPHVGKNHPSRVRADVTINLDIKRNIATEWDSLRKHDVCFLLTIDALSSSPTYSSKKPFLEQVRLRYLRGCEVEGYLDEEGRVVAEGFEKPDYKTRMRTVRLYLDVNQYQNDMEKTIKGSEDVYETFNIIMRRKPKENNFKAVLETIRDMINTECVVPAWLHDIFLGYGDPGEAHYSKMPNKTETIDFNDTFLDAEHLLENFLGMEIKCDAPPEKQVKPFKIRFPEKGAGLEVIPYTLPNPGPYPYNKPKENSVRFTPTQIEAIKAGCNPGLTMVVGPPGTGKTDVAVQVINNIYHNFPNQRTLIVTHSNQALNQLFQKIINLDIDERHLLRLGHGEEGLGTDKDFSKYGRVNYILAHRLELLNEVGRLQKSLGVTGDVTYTCETAGYFNLYQVKSRWEEFMTRLKKKGGSEEGNEACDVKEYFPFHVYFSNAPQPIFKGDSYLEDLDQAEGCYRHIQKIFDQLEEFRAFELMRSGLDRANYLLVKEAKIIAMTCTHAALTRRNLVKLGFRYDNILMEEAAQILEIETFIPLLLQEPEDGHNRLKRVILIGDHHQLPPVIKNMAFQKYSNMEQSLFTRFIRLGVPAIELDKQGRSRASLANLYNWRYKKLGNLPHVLTSPEYLTSNPGFSFDFQLINVEDFNGVGESEPNPYFYQNLGEAEYVVAVYMYMRLLGYKSEEITILTTYNGQKHLIRDVVKQRCGDNPVFGFPKTITTVDRYQGSQNNYILLSLVRTKTVGHLRDVRRLIVAMSRARLGLYVFARVGIFANCYELTPAFKQLLKNPTELHIYPEERCPTNRKTGELPPAAKVIKDMPEMSKFVYDFYYKVIEMLMKEREETEKQREAEETAAHRFQTPKEAKTIEAPIEEDPEKKKKNLEETLSQSFLAIDDFGTAEDRDDNDDSDDEDVVHPIRIIPSNLQDVRDEFQPFPHVKYEEEEETEEAEKEEGQRTNIQGGVPSPVENVIGKEMDKTSKDSSEGIEVDSNKITEQVDDGMESQGDVTESVENVPGQAEHFSEPAKDSPDNEKSGQAQIGSIEAEDVEMREEKDGEEDESDEEECGPSLEMMNS